MSFAQGIPFVIFGVGSLILDMVVKILLIYIMYLGIKALKKYINS